MLIMTFVQHQSISISARQPQHGERKIVAMANTAHFLGGKNQSQSVVPKHEFSAMTESHLAPWAHVA